MNFSGISAKSLLGRLLRFPLKFIPTDTKIPILQGKLRGKRWIVGSSNHGCWLGSYEYEKRLVFEKKVHRDSIVFDIGANVGFYTLLASVLVGSNGRVFAFEPVPRNLSYLRKHLQLNGITNVEILDVAVTDKCSITFFDEGQNSSMGHIASQGQLEVKTVSLDGLTKKGEIPLPDYIKIDVEGAEMLVLSGAKSVLANAHPTIFLATHGFEIHKTCREFLESLGYHLQPVHGESINKTDEIIAYKG